MKQKLIKGTIEMIERFPENILVTVINDTTNRYFAANGGDLVCKTESGERLRVDFLTSGKFEGNLVDLLGKKVAIGYISTAAYFANESITILG
jgi:hypothetical protein